MAKSFVLSKVTTDLLKNKEFGGTGSWRAMGTPDGEKQFPVRLDLLPITKKSQPLWLSKTTKGTPQGLRTSIIQLGVISPEIWVLFFSPKTSFFWKTFLIVKVTSKLLSQLRFYGASSFRDPSVQKYISKLIIKPHPHQKESTFRLIWNVQLWIPIVLRNGPSTSLETRWDEGTTCRSKCL